MTVWRRYTRVKYGDDIPVESGEIEAMIQPIIEHDKSDAQKIRDFVGNIPATLTSVYSTSRVNEDIPLHSGVLATNVLGKALEFEGDIFLDWLPNPRIRLACKLPVTLASFHLFGRANEGANKVLVTLRGINATAEVLITNPSYSSDFSGKQEVGLNGFFANGITFGSTQGMKSLKFHLPNFPDYDGASEVYPVVCTTGKVSVWTNRAACLAPAVAVGLLVVANPARMLRAASS